MKKILLVALVALCGASFSFGADQECIDDCLMKKEYVEKLTGVKNPLNNCNGICENKSKYGSPEGNRVGKDKALPVFRPE